MRAITCLLLIAALTSCINEKSETQKEVTPSIVVKKDDTPVQDEADPLIQQVDSETKTYDYYAGTIGFYDEDVIVEINTEKNMLQGGYWYLKHRKKLSLTGKVSSNSPKWTLSESYRDKVTGQMTLEKRNDSLIGHWYPPGKNSEMQQVRLKRIIKGSHGAILPKFEIYRNEKSVMMFDRDDEYMTETADEVKAVRMGEYAIFSYDVNGTNGHTGHIHGLAKFNKDGSAIYEGEEACKIALEFSEKEVNITELEDCSFYRGMRAYFGGTLKKIR